MTDIRRRSFVAIATERVEGWEPLPDVDDEVAALQQWLCDPGLGGRRFKRRFTELGESPTERQVRRRLGKVGRFNHLDAVVLYVTGHGEVDDNRDHYTILADATPMTMATTCIETKNLLKWLRQQPGLDEVMIVLDLCQAGNLLDSITPQMRQALDGRWFVLGTSAPDGTAKLRAFADTVTATLADLKSGKFTTEKEEYLDSEFFFRAVKERLQREHGQTLVKIVDPGRKLTCLPNPIFDPVDDQVLVAPSRQDLALPAEDMAAHWVPRSRGTRQEDEPGWFFSGRQRVMRRLVDFTTGPAGTLLVAGRAGSGKSAVLARLVTLSDARFRAEHPAVVAQADVLPDEGAVDVAVLATGKSALQIVEQVVLALGGTPPAPLPAVMTDWLAALARQGNRDRPPTIVLDAVDEAADPDGVVQSLLRAMNPQDDPRFRLVVGVRSATSETADIMPVDTGLAGIIQGALAAEPVFVDDEEYWQDADLAAYVERILTSEGSSLEGRRFLAADHARRIAHYAQRSFLLASMVARQLYETRLPHSAVRGLMRSGVAALLAKDLATAFDGENRTTAFRLLRVSALAFGRGIPWRDLWPDLANAIPAGGRELRDEDVELLLSHRTSGYLIRDLEDGVTVYRPFHDALRAALVDTPSLFVGDGQEEPSAGVAHGRIASYLADRVRRQDEEETKPPEYARRHLAEHAVAADDPDALLQEALDDRTLPWLDGDSVSRVLRLYEAPPYSELWTLLSAWRGVRNRWSWDGVAENKTALDAALLASSGWVRERRPPLTGLAWQHRWGSWTWGGTVLGRDMSSVSSLATGVVGDVPVVAVAGTSEMGEPHLQLWETSTGLPIGPPLPHEHNARSLVMTSVDGRPLVAALDGDNRVRLWDASTSQVRSIALLNPARYLAFNNVGGRVLLVAGGFDNDLLVYDVRAGARLDDLAVDGTVRALALGEGRAGAPRLIVGLRRGNDSVVEQRNPVTGARVGVPVAVPGEVNAVAWAFGNGSLGHIAVGTAYGVAQVYDAENGAATGRPLELDLHAEVRTVALDASGHSLLDTSGHRLLLAAGGHDTQARLLDVSSGTELSMPHPADVLAVAFAPVDGRNMLATLCMDGNARLWDTARASGARRTATEVIASLSMTRAGDQVLIAASGTRQVTVWDASDDYPEFTDEWDGEDLNPKAGPTHIVVGVGMVAGQSTLVAAQGQRLRVTDLEHRSTVQLSAPEIEHADFPWPPSLHVGFGGAVAAYHRGEMLLLVDVALGESVEVARYRIGYGHAYLVATASRLLLACGDGERTRLRDAHSGKLVGVVPAPGYSSVRADEVGGHELLSWVDGSLLRVWDLAAGAVVHEFPVKGAPGPVHLARVGDRDVAVVGHHATVRGYDLESGRVIAEFPLGTTITAVGLVEDEASGRAVVGVGGPGVFVTELVDPSWGGA